MRLVTLAEAKRHLRIELDFTDSDDDITLKIHAASALVMNYLKEEGSDSFTDSTGALFLDSNEEAIGVPYEVKAATLLMLGYLDMNRADDQGKAFEQGYLPTPVTALLYPLRDPTVA